MSTTERPSSRHEHVLGLIRDACGDCHRPGQSAPFALLSEREIVERAEQIVAVTERGYMPPWLPEEGDYPLADVRRLSAAQIRDIRTWWEADPKATDDGSVTDDGRLHGRDSASSNSSGDTEPVQTPWQLGTPDLVVSMDVPFALPAEGRDVYRNFVISVPLDRPRWVRGMELLPDNLRVVHHAFMLIDREGECRRLDQLDDQPGFGGMEAEGADSPDGHFVSWQPGKVASLAPDGMAWLLTPGTDLILQMHLQPSGKRESVSASIGFYFTDQPPTRFPVKLVLRSTEIDIPAGEAEYVLQNQYTLPTDVQVIGIIPHAHYLGKRLEAFARLPNGSTKTLLSIPGWDFNWQGDYRYADPPLLPRGTVIQQRFVYDNSAANPLNPHQPPQRVRYGLESADEMGELWLQVEPVTHAGRDELLRDFGRRELEEIAVRSRRRLATNSADIKALVDLGKVTLALESPAQALPLFRRAVEADPQSVTAQYYLGHALLRSGDLNGAREQLNRVRLTDDRFQLAWHDLGLLYLQAGRLPEAEKLFRRALELNPHHATSLSNLGFVLMQQNRPREAVPLLEQASQLRPTDQRLRELLQRAQATAGAGRSLPAE